MADNIDELAKDNWSAARMAIVAPGMKKGKHLEPNLKPLAKLLRSDAPISPGVRDFIAELLDPGDPDILGVRLRAESNSEAKENKRVLIQIVSGMYDRLYQRKGKAHIAGQKSKANYEPTSSLIAELFNITTRSVDTYRKEWKKLRPKLAKRLGGDDTDCRKK